MRSGLIISPPGSGKTTACKLRPTLQDGDLVPAIQRVYDYLNQNYDKAWFTDPILEQLKHHMFQELQFKPIGWVLSAEHHLLPDSRNLTYPVCFIIPSVETLVINHSARLLEGVRNYATDDTDTLAAMRSHYFKIAYSWLKACPTNVSVLLPSNRSSYITAIDETIK